VSTELNNGLYEPSPEACEEKMRLAVAYQVATADYSKAVSELVAKIGVTLKSEYDKLHQAVEQERQRSVEARDRLYHHTTTHGCSFQAKRASLT